MSVVSIKAEVIIHMPHPFPDSNGTIEVSEYGEVEIKTEDTYNARDLIEMIRAKHITGISIGGIE